MMETQRLLRIKAGWLALGNGWAVEGATQEEATERFERAVQRHRVIDARPFFFERLRADQELSDGHGREADRPELLAAARRLAAAEDLLDAITCAGPPSRFDGNDCALCNAAASYEPDRHDEMCDYRRARAFLDSRPT